ncbi:Putative beta-glucosidase 23 [Dendrobium catenatum]|uniref:Beta-glucosidase 23 n=1 Tax=Dendrobium catenatum TaxID=906689 RepID=A0A2I0X0K8_9ASPA|nr:Putative beta-glucosidase 23 [Dendrobium catenatum]
MKKNACVRLPSFTQQQSELVKGLLNFISLNHYTSSFVSDNPHNSQMDLQNFQGTFLPKSGVWFNSFI